MATTIQQMDVSLKQNSSREQEKLNKHMHTPALYH